MLRHGLAETLVPAVPINQAALFLEPVKIILLGTDSGGKPYF